MNILLVLLSTLIIQSCYNESVLYDSEINDSLELSLILKLNGKNCSYDKNNNTLRCPIEASTINNYSPLVEFQDYAIVCFDGKVLKNNIKNDLGGININQEYEKVTVSENQNCEQRNLENMGSDAKKEKEKIELK